MGYDGNNLPPYTQPVRLLQPSFTQKNFTLFTYKPNKFKLCEDIGKEYGFNYAGENPVAGYNWSIPKHSLDTLKFIKIGHNYSNYEGLSGLKSALGTLEECKKAHEFNISLLKQWWSLEASKLDTTTLKPDQVSVVLNGLIALDNQVKQYYAAKTKDKPSEIDKLHRSIKSQIIKLSEINK